MGDISLRGAIVLAILIVICAILSVFVNYGGWPPYVSYPMVIVICLVVGAIGSKYVE